MPKPRAAWSKRGFWAVALVVALCAALWWAGGRSSDRTSTCFGTPARGSLRDGWKLPRRGVNFRAYSDVGWVAGRTFVHSTVHQIVVDAYRSLAATQPQYRFVYGETALAAGGRFRPHRTHQNGLSVDFMVPLRDGAGMVVEIPTNATEKFGYGLEFDDSGRLGDLRIDFEAIALHLVELNRSAIKSRAKVARIIFDPKLRERLAATRAWSEIKALPFMLEPAWIRHDEHYHVDFELPCKPLAMTDR